MGEWMDHHFAVIRDYAKKFQLLPILQDLIDLLEDRYGFNTNRIILIKKEK